MRTSIWHWVDLLGGRVASASGRAAPTVLGEGVSQHALRRSCKDACWQDRCAAVSKGSILGGFAVLCGLLQSAKRSCSRTSKKTPN